MADPLTVVVYGTPQPQGSAKAFYRAGMKHPVITSDNAKLKPWRQEVTATALAAAHNSAFSRLDGDSVRLEVTFYFARPKSHTRKQRACQFRSTKPDVDKLLRAIQDALTGVAYADDAQVAEVRVRKLYGEGPMTVITVAATGDAA